MQSVEITAKSVQEATKVAAEKLGVAGDRLSVTVLEETKGLFGKSSVRVRADVLPEAVEAPPVQKPAEAKPARGRGRGQKAEAAPERPAPIADVQAAFEETPPAPAAPAKGRSRRGGKPAPAETAPAAEATGAEEATEEPVSDIVATEDDANRLAELVREILSTGDLNVTVRPTGLNGRYVNLQLDGKDVAFLVGKHGEVLNAMQYLVNIIAGRRFDNGVRITLDGNDYRRRREDALTQLAVNIAEQVKKRGEEAVLDALPAFERRIVHKALSTYEGISTYSEGEEPNRRVVIAPAE